MKELQDNKDRLLAVTTFDKNVVVTAGAGTGKTTLLVDRITHLLMREPEPLRITDIIAVTFTKKAANEMKIRLRGRLQYFIDRVTKGFSDEKTSYEDKLLCDIMHRYNLSMDQIEERASSAINNMEKAQIGTIHGFAGHILRLYPLEAGLDPDFEEDDGSLFDEHFEREWEEWLDMELSSNPPHGETWKDILRKVSLDKVEILAKDLCRETIPVSSLKNEISRELLNSKLLSWLGQEKNKAQALSEKYEEVRKVKMHDLLRKTIDVLNDLSAGIHVSYFNDNIPTKSPRDWLENDYNEAVRIVSIAQGLSTADDSFIQKLIELILPFASSFRRKFVISGNTSFDGLLSFCCNLLKNKLNIRNYLKNHFKSILVDEFQDTDPLQYEIILYLAEIEGKHETDWRGIKLTPGKIFIVGDPKQSIYAFRGADIEAYHKVVDMIVEQGGVIANLSTNFRSNNGIINVVNSLCRRIIRARDYLQPEYVNIIACPGHEALKPVQRVELRLVDTRHEDENDSTEAVEREAIAIGKFLKEEMIGKEVISDSDGNEAPVSPRHIAILLPKLTQVHEYLDVLRRLQIPYIVEGDRHFYGTQEVIDFVNLLRVLDNPWDKIALAGVLRSPLGGMSDRELYELSRLSLPDYRVEGEKPALFTLLKVLADNVSLIPVPEAIHYIFDNSPVLELAASSYNGEQSVANLRKIYKIAETMSDKSNLTLKGFTALLEKKIAVREEEGESLLSEEGIDAVRILSIHRAKGLEFPVVVVGGIHGTPNRGRDAASVMYDWSGGVIGIRIADYGNNAAIMLQDKEKARQEEEQKRLLYVAMTRARECLVLSGILGKRIYRGSFLSMIRDSAGVSAGDSSVNEIRIDEGIIKQNVIDYTSCTVPGISKKEIRMNGDITTTEKIEELSDLWDRRDKDFRTMKDKRLFITPSWLEKTAAGTPKKKGKSEVSEILSGERSLIIGNIAHYILEHWDFEKDTSLFKAAVEDACSKFMPFPPSSDIISELEIMFETFSGSSAWQELKGAEISGREIPFTIPWDGQVMEGVIDVVYRHSGNIYAADYKTDRVSEHEIADKIKEYTISGKIYTEAVKRCISADVKGFKLIFLRHGKSVNVI